ncbi:MAG: ATP-dependent RNA helicase RhlB [Lentisphaerae bacterium GWF2_57_35]|nr:MAG: ATP-dependent RNA helicase RhlB [Lentisphaerae bacterium GWF2_57_35]
MGFQYCTPIQKEILPSALKGLDVTGRAQTGTGKTAAFLLTIFTRLLRHPATGQRPMGTPRALIMAPTRELVMQIQKDAEAIGDHTGFTIAGVYGGMDYDKQRQILRKKAIDLIVATPGRLLDFKQKRDVDLHAVEILVIDEADRMLDMGFIPDMRKIVNSTPPKEQRQTMLFSATLTPEIMRLASQWMKDPINIEIQPDQVASDSVNQIIYIVTSHHKFSLLYNILQKENPERVIIFANRRDETERLADRLKRHGIDCSLLSGAVPQEKRVRTLEQFRDGKIRVLVATDVCGRGLHVEGISHIINYNVPHDAEDYVHRIGRTGRAGATGTSITFACEEESFYLPQIETYIGRAIKCTMPEEAWLATPPPPSGPEPRREHRRPYSGGSRGPSRRRPPSRR